MATEHKITEKGSKRGSKQTCNYCQRKLPPYIPRLRRYAQGLKGGNFVTICAECIIKARKEIKPTQLKKWRDERRSNMITFENRAWKGVRLVDLEKGEYEITFHISHKTWLITHYYHSEKRTLTDSYDRSLYAEYKDWNELKKRFPNSNIEEFDKDAQEKINELILEEL